MVMLRMRPKSKAVLARLHDSIRVRVKVRVKVRVSIFCETSGC